MAEPEATIQLALIHTPTRKPDESGFYPEMFDEWLEVDICSACLDRQMRAVLTQALDGVVLP
jgi:hypothetical protein